jgi:hypothetical protein
MRGQLKGLVQSAVEETIVLRRLRFSRAGTGHKKRWPVLLFRRPSRLCRGSLSKRKGPCWPPNWVMVQQLVQSAVEETIVFCGLCFSGAETGHKKRWPVSLISHSEWRGPGTVQ